ncbi:DUF2267 domain-containing protein [Oryzibacter oryziterrae]|uniref:DUF2267 domain-containing protein n=1 Tax=Oryzibacter oryziterrae TaxID=2766474 RepID=UPI001F2073B3|nr:DUF2267 domain-containing protein [Oryzibacter oryziterrae]
MQDTIDTIASTVGISPEQTDGAIRIVLNFLHKAGPTETIESLASELGAADYLSAAPKAGLLGSIGGMFGGMGGAMAAFSALQGLGLDMDQIQGVVKNLIDIARQKIGDEKVENILDSIPGLAQLI